MSAISVIIPVYNIARYLDDCVQSVLNQTFNDIEVILVDDGSTDGICPGMCDEYKKNDERVKVIHKTNGGLMAAWMTGVENSTSKYICFVDGDDWVDLDMLESLYARVANADEIKDIVSSNYIIEKKNEKKKAGHGAKPGVYEGAALEELRHKLLGEEVRPVILSRCMKLIERRLIVDNLHYCNTSIKMAEDLNITLPAILDCDRLTILEDGYFYHYRTIADSMAHNYDEKFINNLEMEYVTYSRIFESKGIAGYKSQMDREYVRMLFVELKNELRAGWNGCIERVQKVFKRIEVEERIYNTQLDISSKANKLLYRCMKDPSPMNIAITYIILKLYDKKTN